MDAQPRPHDDDHDDEDELFTLDEVAGILRIPPATLRYWRYEHTGPRSFRVGRHVRYRRVDVLKWIDRQLTTEAATQTER